MRTLTSAYPTAFADLQVGLEPVRSLANALARTVDPARCAFNAFLPIDHWPHRSPVAGFEFRMFCGDRAEIVGNAGLIKGLA